MDREWTIALNEMYSIIEIVYQSTGSLNTVLGSTEGSEVSI